MRVSVARANRRHVKKLIEGVLKSNSGIHGSTIDHTK